MRVNLSSSIQNLPHSRSDPPLNREYTAIRLWRDHLVRKLLRRPGGENGTNRLHLSANSGSGAVSGLSNTDSVGVGPGVLPHVVQLGVLGSGLDQTSTLGELSALELEPGVVQLGNHVDVEDGEDGLGDKVEDTVEDHLAGRGDDVGTVSETPGDGVEGPDDGEEDGRGDVSSLEVWRTRRRTSSASVFELDVGQQDYSPGPSKVTDR